MAQTLWRIKAVLNVSASPVDKDVPLAFCVLKIGAPSSFLNLAVIAAGEMPLSSAEPCVGVVVNVSRMEARRGSQTPTANGLVKIASRIGHGSRLTLALLVLMAGVIKASCKAPPNFIEAAAAPTPPRRPSNAIFPHNSHSTDGRKEGRIRASRVTIRGERHVIRKTTSCLVRARIKIRGLVGSIIAIKVNFVGFQIGSLVLTALTNVFPNYEAQKGRFICREVPR